MSLSKLPNIGKQLEFDLNIIGIFTEEELTLAGSVVTTLRLGVEGNTCYNKLYALEGAIKGIRWHQLSREEKDNLKIAYDSMESDKI